MKNYILVIFLFLVAFSCSDRVGSVSGLGKNFINRESINEYQNRPKTGSKAVFKITHENTDLSDYNILIQNTSGYYYYYGPYQKEITFYFPRKDKDFTTDLTFNIINKKTDSLYLFTSDLQYYIFETNNKPIKVKLLSERQFYKGLEINFKVKGCPFF